MVKNIRVFECGGKGIRRADVIGTEISSVVTPEVPITEIDQLLEFVCTGLSNVTAIAFSVAGVIDNNSVVTKAPNIPFLNGIDLGSVIKSATNLQVNVFNDMETSVIGMSVLFPELNYFMGITWSSGIGLRICKNGEILGDSEGGHIPLDLSPFAPLCGCGQRGCAESILGGKSITRRIRSELEALGYKKLNKLNLPGLLDESFMDEEVWAIKIYGLIAKGMGRYLATLQNIFHLPAVVWKGTFADKALHIPGIEDAIRMEMEKNLIVPAWGRGMKFYFVPGLPDLIPDGEAFLGAATLALRNIYK